MREILKTNDPVVLSFARHLLAGAGIEAVLFDGHASSVEGSIGAIPRRLMVRCQDEAAARRALAEIGEYLTEPEA